MNIKKLEKRMRAEFEAILTYAYEDEFRKEDIKNLVKNLKEYGELRKQRESAALTGRAK